ncbi:hypothetical protein [Afipia clevelandensis]|uniref:Glycosyltransferase RgtA/B/C/D-like domain-containing protein n=1 Tax=Afipia clevelandensis ATCC 49720 TaxID=883079 RepID=K8PBE4_9BRAD|nr:hypothetical protein [Afipia clevelandensis]EKS35663.1 hypothetical protein HMPREF9696_01875 [Afipia clevelandensis ATCC 49720]
MTGIQAGQFAFSHRRAWRACAAAVTLALLVILIGIGFANRATLPGDAANVPNAGDIALYKRIVAHVEGGESYYTVAIRELRDNNYPLRPFVVVRPPVLAVALAVISEEMTRRALLAALAGITFLAWAWRLRAIVTSPVLYAFSLMIIATGIAPAIVPQAWPLHEVWAGLLIALSLAVRRPNAWIVAVILGVAAAIIRELATAYLLAMMVMAFRDGCRKEAAAWALGLLIFAATLAVHAHHVNALVTAADPASPSWLRIGGWPFVLQTTQWNLLLEAAPRWVGVIVVPLALAGLTGRRDAFGQRVMLVVFGYVAAFIFVGRDNNSYWGLMIAPLWPLGLVTVWPALARCVADLRACLVPKDAQPGTASNG